MQVYPPHLVRTRRRFVSPLPLYFDSDTYTEALEWMDEILDRALTNAPKGSLKLTLHVSGSKYAITPLDAPLEKSGSEKSSLFSPNKQICFGRADLPAAIRNAAVVSAQTLGVAGESRE